MIIAMIVSWNPQVIIVYDPHHTHLTLLWEWDDC